MHVTFSIRADLHLTKLALATIVVPFVTRIALANRSLVVCVRSYFLVVADAATVLREWVASVPGVGELASLIKAVAKVVAGLPVGAWRAVCWGVSPFAVLRVKPLTWVGIEVCDAGEPALAQTGGLIPVESGNAALSGWSAHALASAGVPVLANTTRGLDVALAFAVAGIPVVGLWASLLKAVTAAGVDVPVITFVALVGKASALTVQSVFRHEPVLTSRALSGLTLPSAGAGVPELTWKSAIDGRQAEAFTALKVPVVELVTSTRRLSADALAVLIVPPLVFTAGSITLGFKAHAIAVVLAPEVVHWTGFGLAAAHTFNVIKDLVASAHLGSADARANALIIKLVHFAKVGNWKAVAGSHVPVQVVIRARLRHAEASAVVAAPEFVGFTRLLIAHALTDLKVPEVSGVAVLWVLSAHARAISMDVPEVTNRAHLRVLLAAARDSVVVPVVRARLIGAAVALTSREVPSEAWLALCRRAGALASAIVPESAFGAVLGEADALASVSAPVGLLGDSVVVPVVASAQAFFSGVGRLDALAFAAFIVENVVFWADLRGASASAAVCIHVLGEITVVEELVGSAHSWCAAAHSIDCVEVEAWWAVLPEELARACCC